MKFRLLKRSFSICFVFNQKLEKIFNFFLILFSQEAV